MRNTVAVRQIWSDNTPPGHNALNEAGDLISLPLSRMRPPTSGFRLIQGVDGTAIDELG